MQRAHEPEVVVNPHANRSVYRFRETSRKYLGNIQETSRKHPGNIQETSRKHPGNIQKQPGNFQETSRQHPGNIQETSRIHPGNIQETSRKHPGNLEIVIDVLLVQKQPQHCSCAATLCFKHVISFHCYFANGLYPCLPLASRSTTF
jgi:hypothetical protein